IALLATMLLSLNAVADSFYCGTHIIDESSNKTEVAEKCGEPTVKFSDHWIYDRGTDQFDVLVHFEADGSVNRIEEEHEN
ncbi:MAG: DUF2845 domain-containing protein, partial [Gammaproteobacteria bacterium]